ncbi:zf-TFIIB domain-containing protein [Thalassotalea mangrovi]|uniref:GTP-binding protein EngA n=1 Tax=Thalassotalea mangrovi TaxID=2572245 RepID=A0A4U1B3A1_9GAMM|nr:zf-TFIIB domain-containing protein [Thalassotalea mangrovi]TKB44124.1 GTP-binding protein EngA [Thalassotalea mangrovi]
MRCPRTGTKLKTIKVGGISLEVSESCGGVFFDNTELCNFKDPQSVRGSALVKHLRQFENSVLDETQRVNCPKCDNIVMMRRYFSPLKVVEIDECPGCGGIWLDTGELSKLHDNHLTERERALLRVELKNDTYIPNIEAPMHPRIRYSQDRVSSVLEAAFYLISDF